MEILLPNWPAQSNTDPGKNIMLSNEVKARRQKLWNLMDREQNIDLDSLQKAFAHYLEYTVCRYRANIQGGDIYRALAFTVRDFLIDRWNESQLAIQKSKSKRVYYISMEFLLGRLLDTNLTNLGMRDVAREKLKQFGYNLSEISQYEPDAGLGNGGLGRLAACFLDSMATLNLPCSGSSIRYEYGIFHQQIVDGYQTEAPDAWMEQGNPWEIRRDDIIIPVNFYGRTERYVDDRGHVRHRWIPGDSVMAQAYDILIPGYDTRLVTNLRLWKSRASSEFNLDYFNHGDYVRAVEDKQRSETISRILYPNENQIQGRKLRLQQEYFLVAATVRNALNEFDQEEDNPDRIPDRIFFQLNDTHPALVVAELMRLLVDERQLEWDRAYAITQATIAYTNHTVMPEALERWDLDMFSELLPRHMEIIYEINQRFLDSMRSKGLDNAALERMSIIEESPTRKVRMANLAIIGSKVVNGVAALHTEIIKRDIFADFHKLWPEKIQNKTNGITHRRWIVSANEELTDAINRRIGVNWIKDLSELTKLSAHANNPEFQEEWRKIKRLNKEKLARIMRFECGVAVDPESIFDIQVKRIHEYKRQHMNILRVIADYFSLKANPNQNYTPRTVIIAGKAAPGYHRAKMIIKLIHSVGRVVNNDPDVDGRIKVAFLPNYRVSLAERIFPAADLSEQISTAGMEASGTGNMKFMLNGALTVGTMDGANVEMHAELNGKDIYIFGKTDQEIATARANYDPVQLYNEDPIIHEVLESLARNHFSRSEPGIFQEIFHSLLYGGDHYFVLADFQEYLKIQRKISEDFRNQTNWTRASIMNTASCGVFSSDRTVAQYAREIWETTPLQLRPPRVSALPIP